MPHLYLGFSIEIRKTSSQFWTASRPTDNLIWVRVALALRRVQGLAWVWQCCPCAIAALTSRHWVAVKRDDDDVREGRMGGRTVHYHTHLKLMYVICLYSWHDKLAKTKMQKERKSKKRNRKILNRTDNIQNQSDNQAKEVNSKCSRIRKKLRRTEKKQKYAPEAHPMILLCIRNAAERIFSRRNFIRKA